MTSPESLPTREPLRLDQFLKLVGVAQTGGHAKVMIQGGAVHLNGAVELRRGRKLALNDRVEVDGEIYSPNEFLE